MSKKTVILIFFLGLGIIGGNYVNIGAAADEDLANQYAPILYFVDGEQCFPVEVSYAIENSYLYEIGNPTPLSTSPTEDILNGYTSDIYYLDNQRGTVTQGDNGIENDYQSKMNALGYTLYAHVDTVQNVIQYWFFYAFNGGDLNRHEGDWELVQVVLSSGQPTQVMYSQHHSGQSATWNQVDKEGDHVKVYVAKGSHANYIKPYSGKLGLASDTVADNGKIIRPGEYSIDILDTQPWLAFAGRWGWVNVGEAAAVEAELLGEIGPNGPKFREDGTMWQPQLWATGLQPANDIMFVLEWLVYNFLLLFILITLLSLLIHIILINRRKKKYGLGPRVFSLLYIDGANQKSIGNILCIIALIIALLGLFFPWYTVTANVSVPPYQQTGTFNAVTVDSFNGIQIRLPDQSGPIPLGTLAMPFYIIILVGLFFIVLATIGVSESKKLGKKYLLRGIRLLIPFLLILIFVMAVATVIPLLTPASINIDAEVNEAMRTISASPFNGQYSIQAPGGQGGTVQFTWGLGIGAYLLLFASIILMMAGIIELITHVEFFEDKISALSSKKKDAEQKEQQPEDKKQ
jgi:hypothetical protein